MDIIYSSIGVQPSMIPCQIGVDLPSAGRRSIVPSHSRRLFIGSPVFNFALLIIGSPVFNFVLDQDRSIFLPSMLDRSTLVRRLIIGSPTINFA
ncbi:hypothetical protein ZOSMA_146G00830 [Zostera marina]|uniref:Uncharacterized protein n=1 Tax=Zostera marina TaxID=29655 RepID=A0A0K9PZG4_ZOSMR|nr:hypothetical protein ZOSMA_146G00830 [Zostera marina]